MTEILALFHRNRFMVLLQIAFWHLSAKILAYKLINQAVGVALSGLLLVEVILRNMGWSYITLNWSYITQHGLLLVEVIQIRGVGFEGLRGGVVSDLIRGGVCGVVC